MMIGLLLAWIQTLAVQHFPLEVLNLLTKATTFTPVFQLLLVMTCTKVSKIKSSEELAEQVLIFEKLITPTDMRSKKEATV